MERVTGIGGFFFRARDPDALAAWYEERLGVAQAPRSYDESVWRQQEGATVLAPFLWDSPAIGPPEHTWMINFRVRNLDAMVRQLEAAGDGRGRSRALPERALRRAQRPRGKRVQLWQPMDSE